MVQVIEAPMVPLPGVVYPTRQSRQYQGAKRGWRNVIFYLRAINRQRQKYPNHVKATNRLFVLGIWDPLEHSIENPPYEWAFSTTDDQVKMFEVVLKNLVSPKERQRFVGKILDVIKDYGEQVRLA